MASEVLENGSVKAPLNITAAAPSINLQGFQWGVVDEIDGIRPGQGHGTQPQQAILASQDQSFLVGQNPEPSSQSPSTAPVDKPLTDQFRKQVELKDPPKVPHKGPFFPLEQFQGPWAGNGFNMIFRPLSKKAFQAGKNPTDEDHGKDNQMAGTIGAKAGPDDNILEVNLTTEQITFGGAIGDIPNRGLGDQPDIVLAGVPYLQTLQDVTNKSTGKGDINNTLKQGIHFEPGMWLNVPAANSPNVQESIVRMASIPHGTTINAQGFVPERNSATKLGGAPGGPNFADRANIIDTTPFFIEKGPGERIQKTFGNMDSNDQQTRRVPQDLSKFTDKSKGGTGLITTEIIKNPNKVLENANAGLEILETITFEVHTGPGPPKAPLTAGGTANIAFLSGEEVPPPNPLPKTPFDANPRANAHAITMSAKYWVERINYKVTVPADLPGNTTVELFATLPPNSTAPTPKFRVTTSPHGNKTLKVIKVPGIQIQSSQNVILNFFGISWPHVSVSTLVPTDFQKFEMKE